MSKNIWETWDYINILKQLEIDESEENTVWGSRTKTNRSGERDRKNTIAFLMPKIREKHLKKLVNEAIKQHTITELCDITYLTDEDISDLLKHNILTIKDFKDADNVSKSVKKSIFAHHPCDESYEMIKDMKLSKRDVETFCLSKAASSMAKYGIEKKMSCDGWAKYVGRGKSKKHVRLAEFKADFPPCKNKTDVRWMFLTEPSLLSVLDVDDLKASPLSAKEMMSFLKRDLRREHVEKYLKSEWVDWLEQEVFLETLDGTSKNSRPMQENLEYLKGIISEKSDKVGD